MKLIKEPHPLTVSLAAVALCWVGAAVLHGTYISDLAVHAADLGVYFPGWLGGFVAIPAWLWLLPAGADAAAALLTSRLDMRALRAVATITFGGVLAYAVLALAVLYYVSFAAQPT